MNGTHEVTVPAVWYMYCVITNEGNKVTVN